MSSEFVMLRSLGFLIILCIWPLAALKLPVYANADPCEGFGPQFSGEGNNQNYKAFDCHSIDPSTGCDYSPISVVCPPAPSPEESGHSGRASVLASLIAPYIPNPIPESTTNNTTFNTEAQGELGHNLLTLMIAVSDFRKDIDWNALNDDQKLFLLEHFDKFKARAADFCANGGGCSL